MNHPISPYSIPDLNQFPRLMHAVSPRFLEHGSGKREPLRLGRDDMDSVSAEHRIGFLKSVGCETEELFLLRQTHSNRVRILDNPDLRPGEVAKWEGDALITSLTGKPVGVMTADCLPIVLYDPKSHAVGVVHAGRLGTQQGILSACVGAMIEAFGSRPEGLFLGMGPGIGSCCYEVDADCIVPFQERFKGWENLVSKQNDGKFRLDLVAANIEEAKGAGIPSENIYRSRECTACNVDRWYSYRKEGTTGRMVTLAMLVS